MSERERESMNVSVCVRERGVGECVGTKVNTPL